MKYDTILPDTKTYFPLLVDRVSTFNDLSKDSACMVGASDGKFVVELVKLYSSVTAIEIDKISVIGGEKDSSNGKIRIEGLSKKINRLGLSNHVKIINEDWNKVETDNSFDLIFTSCSWHYSLNFGFTTEAYIQKMLKAVKKGGIFCVEYMMPSEPRHYFLERYTREGYIRNLCSRTNEWDEIENFYSDVFPEKAHMGNLEDHYHRMGFYMAQKRNG